MERSVNISPMGAITVVAIFACVIADQVICQESDQGFIVSRLNTENRYEHNKLHQSFVEFLFGNQFALGQYCSSQLTSSEKLSNDEQIESLYNGTFLGALEGSADWRATVPAKLVESIRLSMKSRQELAVLCSMSSWRYASAHEEHLANAPHQDDNECASQIELLGQFVAALTSHTNGVKYERETRLGSPSSCAIPGTCQSSSYIKANEPLEPKFRLHYYNQFHSFGRLPSGPPHKQNMLPGDYDNCARLASTRYCLGSYGHSPGGGSGDNLYHIGMCLPRACTDRFLSQSPRHMQLLNSIVQANLIGSAIPILSGADIQSHHDHLRPQLQDIFCPPAEDSLYMKLTKDRLSIVLLYLALAWFALMFYGTFRGTTRLEQQIYCGGNKSIMETFDLTNNWRAFVDSRELDPRLSGLSAIKTVAMIWLLITHFSMTIWPYVKNLNELHLYYGKSLQGPLILQGQHVVPSFFLISGLLVGFKYLSKREQQVDFKQMIVWRYSRLMPMYLLVWVYVRQFSHLLGTGPFWDSGVSAQSEVRQCIVEAWWVPLLMLANFTPPYAHCLITGWHIANDFQIYLLLPVLLLAYRRSRFLGSLVALSSFVISHLSHVLLWGTSDNYDLGQLMRDPSRFGPRTILERMALDYVNPIGRVSTYFLGIFVADLLLEQARTNSSSATGTGGSKAFKIGDHLVLGQRSPRGDDTKDQQSLEQWPTDGHERRRSSTVSVSLANQIISVDVLHASSAHVAHGLLSAAANSDSTSSSSNALLEGGFQTAAAAVSENCGERTTATSEASTRTGRTIPKQRSAKYKDICVLTLSASNFLLVMYSIALELDKLPQFGVYTKAIAYPACRILIELSWSVFLYYLLRGNVSTTNAPSACVKSSATCTAAEDSQVAIGKSKVTGGENKLLLMMMTSTTTRTSSAAIDNDDAGQSGQKERTNAVGVARTNPVVRLMRLPCWNVLVKLNYALMLTHYALMRYVIQTQRDLFHFTWTNFAQMATFLIISCYLLALFVHLTIEMPLSSLVRRFLTRAFPAAGHTKCAPDNNK